MHKYFIAANTFDAAVQQCTCVEGVKMAVTRAPWLAFHTLSSIPSYIVHACTTPYSLTHPNKIISFTLYSTHWEYSSKE